MRVSEIHLGGLAEIGEDKIPRIDLSDDHRDGLKAAMIGGKPMRILPKNVTQISGNPID
jgi:hypothetical protein